MDTIYAAETTDNGQTTYYFSDDVDALPPDARNFHTLNMGTLDSVRAGIAMIEADGSLVCWQVGDEFYETERR